MPIAGDMLRISTPSQKQEVSIKVLYNYRRAGRESKAISSVRPSVRLFVTVLSYEPIDL